VLRGFDATPVLVAPGAGRGGAVCAGGLLARRRVSRRILRRVHVSARCADAVAAPERATLPGAAEPARDAAFLRGDRTAGFDAYAVGDLRDPLALAHAARWNDAIAVLRAVREGPGFPGRSIAAALLEGDAYAACGSYDDARTTWYRAFSTPVLRGNDRHRFFPEWTSAMNRWVHERGVAVHASSAPGCRELPPPLADPVS
jgi:hypothetical protein